MKQTQSQFSKVQACPRSTLGLKKAQSRLKAKDSKLGLKKVGSFHLQAKEKDEEKKFESSDCLSLNSNNVIFLLAADVRDKKRWRVIANWRSVEEGTNKLR